MTLADNYGIMISTRERENTMILTIEQHGKVFKVFLVIEGQYDGKNRRLLGKFKTSNAAESFMQNYRG